MPIPPHPQVSAKTPRCDSGTGEDLSAVPPNSLSATARALANHPHSPVLPRSTGAEEARAAAEHARDAAAQPPQLSVAFRSDAVKSQAAACALLTSLGAVAPVVALASYTNRPSLEALPRRWPCQRMNQVPPTALRCRQSNGREMVWQQINRRY